MATTRPHGRRSTGSPRAMNRQMARARLTTMTTAPVAMKIATAKTTTAPRRWNGPISPAGPAIAWRRHHEVPQRRCDDDRQHDEQPFLPGRARGAGRPDGEDDRGRRARPAPPLRATAGAGAGVGRSITAAARASSAMARSIRNRYAHQGAVAPARSPRQARPNPTARTTPTTTSATGPARAASFPRPLPGSPSNRPWRPSLQWRKGISRVQTKT